MAPYLQAVELMVINLNKIMKIIDKLNYLQRRANALGWLNSGNGTLWEYLKLIPLTYRFKLFLNLKNRDRSFYKREYDSL